jgi:hypothetical protein
LQRYSPPLQVKLIDQCGHLPQIEYSDMFNEAALSFLAEVDRSEGGHQQRVRLLNIDFTSVVLSNDAPAC